MKKKLSQQFEWKIANNLLFFFFFYDSEYCFDISTVMKYCQMATRHMKISWKVCWGDVNAPIYDNMQCLKYLSRKKVTNDFFFKWYFWLIFCKFDFNPIKISCILTWQFVLFSLTQLSCQMYTCDSLHIMRSKTSTSYNNIRRNNS